MSHPYEDCAEKECKLLAQKQYRLRRHDRVGVIVHWVMCKRYKFSNAAKWYEYTPETVLKMTSGLLCTDHPQTGAKRTRHLNC